MSIRHLKQRYDAQLVDASNKITEYKDTITSFSVIEDPRFKKPQSQVSISKLNDQIQNLTDNLNSLNELWIIKGLINEIEVFLDPELFLSNMEVLFHHFESLSNKLKSLSESLIVKLELTNKYQELIDLLAERIANKFKCFLSDSDTFVEEVEALRFGEFVEWVDKFGGMDDKINLADLIGEYKLIWESYILGVNFRALELKDHRLTIRDGDGSVNQILDSVLSFIKYIEQLGVSNLHRFYESKISNKLINLISQNISGLINDDLLKAKLLEIISFSQWNLSIDLTNDNFSAKLNGIYNNWLVDNYIDRIRKTFVEADLESVSEIRWEVDKKRYDDIQEKMDVMEKKIEVMSTHSKDSGREDGWNDWNEEWDDKKQGNEGQEQEQEEEEEDGWDDGWNDEWDENEQEKPINPTKPPNPAKPPKPNQTKPRVSFEQSPQPESEIITTHVKISNLPNQLIEIINDFQVDSIESFDPLISSILALSTIIYPSISESYLVYNDLQYLYKNIGSVSIKEFTENLIKRSQNELSRKMFGILINIKIEGDNKLVLQQVDNWFSNIFDTNLVHTNSFKFKELMQFMIEFINNWLINLILSVPDITEDISENLTNLIIKFEAIFKSILASLNEEVLESMHKLNNIKYVINNHIREIMDRFYEAEFYNLSTNELVTLMETCFIKSDVRDNAINDIIEVRNVA